MNCFTNSFSLPNYFARLTFLIVLIALPALGAAAQNEQGTGPYQKASHTAARPCSVRASSAVTHLVKNNVELSVTEDWDCDGHADAYDNCIGMANATQADTNSNGIGDTCEAVTIVRAGLPAKSRSITKAKTPKPKVLAKSKPNPSKPKTRQAKAADKRPRPDVRKRRNT